MNLIAKNILIGTVVLAVIGLGVFAVSKTHHKPQTFQKVTEGSTTTNYNLSPTTLFFGGDIMLSRNVAAKMYAADDFTLPFLNIADKTKSADVAFANLESPFNDHGDHSVEGSLIFNADPKSIAGLKFAGFDIVSTANNHTLDQSKTGLNYTYNLLKQNGIVPIGTTLSCHNGEILTRNDIKFGFLAYSYTAHNDGGKIPDKSVCDANDLKQLKTDITNLRPKVDVLIVSMHAGTEYTRTPNKLQTDVAQTAADSGADFVIGAHPHWIQKPLEKLDNKTWVFYSLGNLVFDQMWSQDTREGLTVEVTYKDKTLDKIELNPVIIDNFCCPRWASEDEIKIILSKIGLNSQILFENKAK
jgi:poly-gamma-glutamate capsule biosynthesis protein CapA/YwtB (metallophosphatase superfamily)